MLLGSVAQGVLEYSKWTVLLIRPGHTSFSTAVVDVDGSKEALRALQFLRSLSLAPHSSLVLTRVVQLISKRSTLRHPGNGSFSAAVSRLNDKAMTHAEEDLVAAQDVLAGSRAPPPTRY